MYSVDFHDKWLDPPDEPSHAPCDWCGEIFDTGDLTKVKGQWACNDCIKALEAEENE